MDHELVTSDHPEVAGSTDLGLARTFLARAELGHRDAAGHRDTVLDFVDREPGAAQRATLEGHLTGSALVVDATGERTLLMLHRKLGRWFQPGGHCDGDTNLAGVALREAAEETGIAGLRVLTVPIDVDVHRVAPPGEPPHLHMDTRFLVVAPPGATEQANEESLALRWVSESELDDLDPAVDPGTRRLVAVGLARARQVLG
jgi:8-oxo-dGTP pyrophosphatase MutT (NUDIX family)